MNYVSHRNIHLAIFLGCIGLLITAIFIEPFKSMNPCPMCMMQRAVFVSIAIVSLLAALHNPVQTGAKVYSVLTALLGLLGMSIAGRQVWLQNLPEDQIPACGPGLEYMLDVFPILEVIEMSLLGTGDCAEVQWEFLGLTIPGWSLIAFGGILCLSVFMFFQKPLTKSAPK